MGFFGDYVFNRFLKTNVPPQFPGMAAAPSGTNVGTLTTETPRENIALHQNMMQSELYTNAGFLALNIWDRFDIFCTLGTTNAYIKGSSNAFNLIGLIGKTNDIAAGDRPNVNIGNAFVELYTDSEFSWSIGARGALWECGCATLGAEFQYAQAKPDVSQINVVSNVAQFSIDHPQGFIGEFAKLPLPHTGTGADGVLPPDMSKAKSVSLNYSEWQVGLALAYRLNFISPYIGIKWSKAKFDFDGAYIAQPQLSKETLNLVTWNPGLRGAIATGAADQSDFLTKVSVTLNKLKSIRLLFILRAFLSEKLSYIPKKPPLHAVFFGDYVFNRFLKTNVPPTFTMSDESTDKNASGQFQGKELSNPALHQNMMQSELYTNAGFLALNIWDRFDIFCTLGTTNAYIKGSSKAFNLVGLLGLSDTLSGAITGGGAAFPNASIGNAFVELYTDSEFAWSIGARGALWECGCATLGAEFQYAQAKPDVSQINVVSNVAQFSIDHPKGFVGEDAKLPLPTTASDSILPDFKRTKSISLNYNEWQVGLALTYRLNFISPYIGIKWSKAKFDFDGAYIAQPQLKDSSKASLFTWNPTLAGIKASAANVDVLTKVSVTLNKLKSKRL